MIDNIHFMRPHWLWLILVILLPLFWWFKNRQAFSPWQKICHNHLLKHILGDAGGVSFLPFFLFITAWILAVLAGAGPSFEKYPVSTYKTTTPIVVLLSVSQEMLVTDIAPNRFERAKFKIIDFLKNLNGGGRVAFAVFSDYAYTLVPFTDDINVIDNMLKAVDISIMPTVGQNLVNALIEAETLLDNTNEQGQIVVFTSSAGSKIDEAIERARAISSKKHQIAIIGVGTTKGGILYNIDGSFVKNHEGRPIMSRLDEDGLDIIATAGDGIYSTITVDYSDIKKIDLLSNAAINLKLPYQITEIKADEWKDLGANLLILVTLIAAFAFRRGWFGCWFFLFLLFPLEVHAFSFSNLFANSNQKAKALLEKKDYQAAAELFQDDNWKATSYYRAGNYQKAQELWQKKIGETELYNMGNALAFLENYQGAIALYDKVLSQNPNHADAQFNKELLEKLLAKQSQSSADKNDNQEQKKQEEKSPEEEKQEEKKASDENNQNQQPDNQSLDSGDDGSNKLGEQEQKDANQNHKQEQDNEGKDEEQKEQEQAQPEQEKDQKQKEEREMETVKENLTPEFSEKEQSTKQLLERVEDDPKLLLKNILRLRYMRMERKRK